MYHLFLVSAVISAIITTLVAILIPRKAAISDIYTAIPITLCDKFVFLFPLADE